MTWSGLRAAVSVSCRQLRRVGARTSSKARQKTCVFRPKLIERARLCFRVHQDAHCRIISVGLELIDRRKACGAGRRTAEEIKDDERCPVQIVGCQVWTEIGAVSENAAAIVLER